MKTRRGVLAALIMIVTFVTASLNALADGFDAGYYAQKYPDVVAQLGTDPGVLYEHYITFGVNEGRFQNRQEEIDSMNASSGNVAQPAAPAPAADISQLPGGGTYVDVDIAAQTVNYYENGVVKLSTPCVTGNSTIGNGTPTGMFAINTKTPGKYLTGPTWNVWVDRWMRFTPNQSIGLHDANWRSNFGGDIYLSSGSHGCVNLPHDVAVQLYDMVSVGTVVSVH